MHHIAIKTNNGIIDNEFCSIIIEYQTEINKPVKTQWFTTNVNKKGITKCQLYGYRITIDVINNKILSIDDVSTIRNGTAKICQYMNR